MSDTPRTDHAAYCQHEEMIDDWDNEDEVSGTKWCNLLNESRQLERELNETRNTVRDELQCALFQISEAQKMLNDNYPKWNQSGQKYAVSSAIIALREAHARIYKLQIENT